MQAIVICLLKHSLWWELSLLSFSNFKGELLKVSEGQISPASVENATLENDKMIREGDEEHIKVVLLSTWNS